MESSGKEVNTDTMDVELIRVPKRREPIDVMNNIFLKTVHFVNPDLSKCVILGIFKNRGNSLGVLFKGRKGSVFWSLDNFNQFSVYFNDIHSALQNQKRFYHRLDGGEDIKTKNVFGRSCAFLYDGDHTLTLDRNEWSQFISYLPIIHRDINILFYNEHLIQEYIQNINSSLEDVLKPDGLPSLIADRLLDEVRNSNGCGS